jgi:Zn-dependent M28 family amino/carboxypeptidase
VLCQGIVIPHSRKAVTLRFLLPAALLLLAGCVSGGGEVASTPLDIPEVAPGNISTETMKQVTRELSSDAYEGRFPGSKGEEKTLAYLVKKWTEIGLQPGNNGSWFQDVPLVEISGENYGPIQIAGKDRNLSLAHGTQWVGVSFREDAHIALKDSELVFVGYGIYAPEKGWNDYAGIDMHGKTAVILVNDPDWIGDQLGGLFGGAAMTYYGRWTYKFEEAARQGAAGALIIHDTFPASYGWNVVESGWTGPQAYAERADGGADQTLVNGWIEHDAAKLLMAAAGKDLTTLEGTAMQKGFKPVPLGLAASTAFDNTIRRYTSHNVVGILAGSERPGEVVIHSAHWDHLGRCKANAKGDDICNGAVDNAAGVGAITALAEAQVKAGPAPRSMVFIALTAEEQGLLGSEYYAANPVFPLDHTVGGLNIDTPLLAGPAKDVTVIGGGKSELDGFLAKALAESGRYASPDPTPQAGLYYRSDHFSFAKRGVPMLYIEGGDDFATGGKAAGGAYEENYTTNRYHGPDDEFDPKWDWSVTGPDLELEYKLGRMMATSTSWPDWVQGDEFRRIRDESCKPAGGC